MKVIGIVGSHRSWGNTEYLGNDALNVLKKGGFEAKFVRLSELKVAPARPARPAVDCLPDDPAGCGPGGH